MRSLLVIGFATVMLVHATGIAGFGASARRRVPEGLYAGEEASLRVLGKGAEIDLACAHGFVTRTIRTGHDGSFDVVGTLSNERGPVRSPARAVRITGTLTGTTIVFTIRDEPVQPGGEVLGPFTVKLGVEPSFAKCV